MERGCLCSRSNQQEKHTHSGIMVPLCGHDYLKDLSQVKKQMCKRQTGPRVNPLTKRSSVKPKENEARRDLMCSVTQWACMHHPHPRAV